MNHQKGITLIELLIAIIISSIAFLGITALFVSERSFWALGRRQAEAQRDAQMAVRSMARLAREGTGYTINNGSQITVAGVCGSRVFETVGVALQLTDNCAGGAVVPLIDGGRSKVTELAFTAVPGTSKLVNVHIKVTHEDQKNEILDTQLFLRNA